MEIDAAMKYCPRCRDEYRPEIESCASCAVSLVSGDLLLASADRQRHSGEPAAIAETEEVALLCAGSLLDMKHLRRELSRRGVASLLASDEQCRTGCRGPQIQLFIRPGDAAVAASVLREEHERTTVRHEYADAAVGSADDGADSEASCPACGSSLTAGQVECPECGLCFG